LRLKEWKNFVIEEVCSRKRFFHVIEFAEGYLRVGIDKSHLVNPADTFVSADIKGILRSKISRVLRFDLTMGFIFVNSQLADWIEGRIDVDCMDL
jgi:hypothetical protein